MTSIESYPNDRTKLGLVEIINNLDSEQDPTKNDVRELTHAFRWIGMKVNKPNLDLKADEMEMKLDQILNPERDLKDFNIFVLVIICHGKEGDKLLSSDGKTVSRVAQIVERLDDLEDMQGRPKILIVECCRGQQWNTGRDVPSELTKNAGVNPQNLIADIIPRRADIFVAFGTVPDFVSHTLEEGSPFILVLTEKLKELSDSCDLEKILTVVKSELSSENFHGMRQMPQTTSTLRKEVILKIGDKTHFEEGIYREGIKYRKFGDRNGWGQMCWEDQHFRLCNFQDGKRSWIGWFIHEWPDGLVQEVNLDPGSVWDDWSGEGAKYNIRERWRYEGHFKSLKEPESGHVHDFYHGSGFYASEDGNFYVGNYHYGKKCGFGTLFSYDRRIIACGKWKDDKIIKRV